jgi:hypothetical protein
VVSTEQIMEAADVLRTARKPAGRQRPQGAACSGPVAARRGVSPVTSRWAGPVLLGLGLVMIPWVVYLHTELPATAHAAHWAWTWTGLDVLEGFGLIATGQLLRRRDARASLTAAVTSALLVIDAWFDTMTAASGQDLLTAVAMALGAELPLAAVCASLAWSRFPRVR